MKKTGICFLTLICGIFALFTLFSSCEVGLGSAVDTQPPSIVISNPPVGVVVRDNFALSGTFDDDGTIDSVGAVLVRADQKGEPIEIKEFTLEDDPEDIGAGTWSIPVNVLDENKNSLIADGEYQASISIKDKAGRITKQNVSFKIDNTPPVVVLQRPSSAASETDIEPDLFGQTLSLTGQAADDNDISSIRINFYSDETCTQEIHHVILYNVPPTISLDVATFVAGQENDYAKIYGSTSKEAGKKTLYCSIIAYDDAKRLPATEEDALADDELGNSTSTYYLYDSIYSDILSEFKVTELYSIMDGNYSSDDTQRMQKAAQIPQMLKNNYSITTGKLALNPANNPEYKIIGREGLKQDGSDFTSSINDLTNDSKITVKADVGLDAIPLNKNSLRIYLLPCNADGIATVADTEANRIYPNSIDSLEKAGSGYNVTTRITKDDCSDKDGNPVLLTVGRTYIISIEGEDSKGNKLVPEDGKTFGFKLSSNGAAPQVDIKTCVNPSATESENSANYVDDSMVYVPKYKPEVTPAATSVIRFKGTINVEDGEPEVRLTIDNGQSITVDSVQAVPNKKGEYTFTKDIAVTSFDKPDVSGQHNIAFFVSQADTTKVTKSVMYQVDAPKVTLSRTEPTAYNYQDESGIPEKITVNGKEINKKYLNGKNVKLNVTIIAGAVGLYEGTGENDPKRPKIEFIQGGTVKKTIDSPSFGETDAIDTTQFEEGELLIRITAYDMAGNKSVAEDTFYVNQATDIPVILPKITSNSTLAWTQEQAEDLNNKTYNVYSAKQTVAYKLIDDDGLDKVEYTIYTINNDSDPSQYGTKESISVNGTTDYQVDITMPEDPGIYMIDLTTNDINTINSTGTEPNQQTKTFYIRVTAAAPTINEIILQKTTYKGSDSLSPVVPIKSDQIPFILRRTITDFEDNVIADFTKEFTKDSEGMAGLNTASPRITDSITIDTSKITASGNYTINYEVEDKNGKKGTATKDIVVDLNAPVLSELKLDGNAYAASNWYYAKTITLTVKAQDAASESGIATVEYSTNGTSWSALSYDSELSTETDSYYSGTAVFNSEGDANRLYVRAKDNAGNIGKYSPEYVNVKIDTSFPELTIDTYTLGDSGSDKPIDTSKIYVKPANKLTLKGTYKDDQSTASTPVVTLEGLGALTVTTQGNTWTAVSGTIANNATLGKLNVSVTNGAGKSTIENSIEFVLDNEPPVLTNISIATDATNSNVYKKTYTEYYVNNTKKFKKTDATTETYPKFTISGIATDKKGVESVTLYVGDTKIDETELSDFSFTGLDWHEKTSSITVKIEALDIAGNLAEETITVKFDTTAPKADHKIDDSLKNLEFRIGDYNNDKADKEGSTDPKDLDVGGKYSDGTYGSALTMQIRGNFPDETGGSGIEKFYYKTFNNEEVIIDSSKTNASTANGKIYFKSLEDLKDYVITNKTDVFSPLATVDKKNVEYNIGPFGDAEHPVTTVAAASIEGSATLPDRRRFDGDPVIQKDEDGKYTVNEKGYVQFRTEVDTNFKTTIKGFQEGKNFLVIVAEDKVGNAAVDYAIVSGVTYPCYSLNVDITAPTIPTKPEGSVFTNLKETGGVVISGTVSDKPNEENGSSGLKKIVFTRDGGSGSVELKTFTAPTDAEITAATKVSELYATDTTLKHWEADISSLLPTSGMAIISAKVVDNAGFETSVPVANITVDINGPTIKVNSPSVNAKVGTSFELSGTVEDGNGAGVCTTEPMVLYYTTKVPTKLTTEHTAYADDETSIIPDTEKGWVVLTYSNQDAALAPKFSDNGSDWSATFKVPDTVVDNNETKNIYFAISAKDLSGTKNIGYSTPQKITVDRIKPSFDSEKAFVGGVAHNNVDNSWFNSDTLNIKGQFNDDTDGSGVTTIWYKLGTAEAKDLPTTDGSYNTNISGFTNDISLKIWAEDKVGNKTNDTPITYTIKIDKDKPEIEKKTNNLDKSYTTNGSTVQKLDFYIKEAVSGIPTEAAKYALRLGSSTVALTKVSTLTGAAATGNYIVIGGVEGTGANKKYSIEIQLGTSAFSNLSGPQPVTITVQDNAGNLSAATIIGNMDIDSTAPVPSFTTPSANSKVNKEVTINGRISEKNTVASITLTATYGTGNSAKTNTFTYSKDAANNTLSFDKNEKEWSITFNSNVAAWNNTNAAQTWTFSITATDEAGNVYTDSCTRKFIIDQNSDRPVIKFSNLDISAMTASNRIWITKEDLYASVSDDDGEVQSVEISFDGTNWSSEDALQNPYYTTENGLAYPIPSGKDGEQTVYFRVKDAKDTVFTSSISNTADTAAPKLAYKTTEFGDAEGKYSSVIYAKVDLGDPAIPLAYYTTASDETAPVANAEALLTLLKTDSNGKLLDELTDTAKQRWKDLSGVKTAVGGTTKYIYIFAKAKDANGIDTITAKFDEDSKPAVYTIDTDDVEASGKGKLALFRIDITSAQTKDYKLELKATDKANRNITRTFDMNIDKQAPEVIIESPTTGASLYGTPGVADSNVTVRGRSDSDAAHIFMAVKESESDTPEDEDWVEITKNSALTWTVIFNGKKGQASQTDYYEDRFNTWVDTLYGTGTSTDISITEKPVCLYFYAVDALGNTGIDDPEKLSLTIFTQGDRPTVEITSPEKPENNVLSTVGGIITITGSTTIAINSVENIWLQIDPDYEGAADGSDFDEEWEDNLNELITGMNEEQLGYKIEASGNGTIGNAIKAGGSKTSWNRAINKNSEFNKKNDQNELINRTIAVRAYAVSASGKVSSCDTVVFTLDPNAPVFGQLEGYPLKLVQYNNDNPAQGIKASRLYEAGLYLKGKWWLTGSVSDDSGIASITMDNVSVMANCSTTGAAISGKYNYLMNIPLEGAGKVEHKIVAQEGASTNKTSELPIVVNFDGTAPDFASTSLNAAEPTQIVQSDGVYEIRGNFNDYNGSGFERIAFYVTREVSGVNYLTDIMIPQGTQITDNSYALTSLTHTASDNNDLYWQRITDCKIQNNTEILLTSASLPSYIRRGAVCRIDNILYRINEIESSNYTYDDTTTDPPTTKTYHFKLTIDSKISDAASKTVDIALAQIIDHKVAEQGVTESYDTTYDSPAHASEEKFSNDDHDQMVERFNETSGEWTVSINSQNIKDGAITIHFVAYDKAGNITYKAYQGVVANNAPRFAGVTFGTDVNGDGKVEGTAELKSVYTGWYNADSDYKKEGVKENGKAANGNKITTWALPNNDRNITVIDDTQAPVMTVKGKIKIIPEIVGGNNGLGWNYKLGEGDYVYSQYKDLTSAGHSGTTEVRNTETTAFEIDTAELLSKISEDGINKFTFTISDKTGGSLNSNSNSTAELILKMNVALRDGVAPTAGIKPFYWKAAGDGNNSLYYSGTPATAQGHIELPKDLPEETFAYKSGQTVNTGLYDVDPKVSGIVYLEGFAKDNVVVEELWLRTTKSGATAGAFTKVASRDRNTGTEQTPNTNYGNFKADTTLAGAGMEFISCTEKTVTEDGLDYNVVYWKVAIDTAKIANVAATDIAVEVQAKDRGVPSVSENTVTYDPDTKEPSATSTTQTGVSVTNGVATFTDEIQTPYYRVDVVPYVTEVKRYNKYNTNRARSGAVSLLRGEANNLVKGFNLASDTNTSIKIAANKAGTESAVEITTIAVSDSDLKFTVPTGAKTGYLHVVVNGVPALNNMNAYKEYNTETNAKAYDHNTLTDDRYVHIWRVTVEDTFKGSLNANYPAMSADNDGNLYASFTNYGESKTYYSKAFTGATPVTKSSTGTTNTNSDVVTVFYGYDPPEDTDISVGADGNINVFYNANYHGGSDYYWGDGQNHNNTTYAWNNTQASLAGGIYVYDNSATETYYNQNSRIDHKFYRFELYTYDNELNQFKNMRVNRTYDSTNSKAYVNVVYYDRLTNAIKYSYATDETGTIYTPGNTDYTFTYTSTGTYSGYYATSSNISNVNGYVKIGDNYYKLSYNTRDGDFWNGYTYYCTFTNYTSNESSIASPLYTQSQGNINNTSTSGLPWVVIDGDSDVTDNSQLVPDHQTGTNNKFSFAGNWTPVVLPDSRYSGVERTGGTGESVSLTSNQSGYPVIFYFDAESGEPRIAFANSRTPNTAANWTVQGVFAEGDDNYNTASDYMSCMVDGQGYLHIAFQNTKGQLVYAKSTNNPLNGTTAYTFGASQVLDDSGMWIDMTMNGDTPYISYLSRINSYDGMKIAFLDPNFDENNDGEADGGWETLTAALDAKVTNVRTCIEPNAKAADYATTNTKYTVAIGYHPGSDYRAAFYVGQ